MPPSPLTQEGPRRQRLRAQDGRPLLPPPGLEHLIQGGEIPPHKLQEARAVWAATRQHLEVQPSDIAAAERLAFLVIVLRNCLLSSDDRPGVRALVESVLEVMSLPRHRQSLRCSLAREAVKGGDLGAAEAWLAGCDPYSEDLAMDSEYRVTRAFIDTASHRFDAVLQILGGNEQEVPIQDSLDAVATVLRANAWERQGQLANAQNLLARFMGNGGQSSHVEHIIRAMPPQWQTCAQSMEHARTHVRHVVGNRAASGGGGVIMGAIVTIAGCIPLVVLVGSLIAGEFEAPMLFMLIFPIIFGGMGLRMMRQAKRAQRIAREGIQGRGRIVNVERTGTEINNVPVMRIHLQLQVPGHPAVAASATQRLAPGQASMLIGRDVGVIWHPEFPAEVVMDL